MKVLHYADAGEFMNKHILVNYLGRKGGGILYAYEMTKGLLENGGKVSAIIPEGIENAELWRTLPLNRLYFLKTYNSNVTFLTGIVRFLLKEKRMIKRIFSNDPIDYIYIPMIQPWSGLLNRIFPNVKVVATLHDPIPHKGSGIFYANICKRIAISADEIVVLSEKFVDFTAKHYKHDLQNVYIIPHGIFDNYKKVYDNQLKHKYDDSKINFLFFGRITPYKGLNVLARAYKKLSEEYSNVALTIVGNGNFSPYQESYKNLKNVTIINRWIKDEEVYGYFENKNIITVLPYIEATQSGVIPLAMSNESFVICTNCGGLSEQVEDGVTGRLIPPNDEEKLYEAMKDIVINGIDAEIVNNASKHIKSLSWNKLSAELLDIVQQEK